VTKSSILAIVGGTFAVLVTVGAFVAMPYLTIYGMYNSVKNHDAAALSSHVDFPALRESVKTNLNATVASTLSRVNAGPLGQLGNLFASSLASPLVDAMVSPEGVSMLMIGQKPNALTPAASAATDPDLSMGYEDFGTFVVTAKPKGATTGIDLVFTRSGLGWVLSGVRFGA